jgi:hypothetical protein
MKSAISSTKYSGRDANSMGTCSGGDKLRSKQVNVEISCDDYAKC